MTDAELRAWIDFQPQTLGNSWIDQLDERKRAEAEFHDEFRADHKNEQKTAPNQRFYEAATIVSDYIDSWIERNAGARTGTFLDYACGDGMYTIEGARGGAHLAVGIDISETSVRNAGETAAATGLQTRTRFLQRDCEDTGFPSGSFSTALCSGMLHHLELSRAFPELARIMAPGGKILCVEALHYNPVIQYYRNRTPELRTDWEKGHILGLAEVNYAKKWFNVENMKFFLMAAPLATF